MPEQSKQPFDSTELELIQREVESSQESLRLCDKSLHTLAFAYITTFSLCVPALLNRNDDIERMLTPAAIGIVLFVTTTLFFFGLRSEIGFHRPGGVYRAGSD